MIEPPGALLREIMRTRLVSLAEMAIAMHTTTDRLLRMLDGREPLNAATVAEATGTLELDWARREADYREALWVAAQQ